jgi:O-antigen ligase
MPALVATVIYALLIAGLFWMDRDRKARVSAALWIPVVWVFLAGSRLVSEWLNPGLSLDNPDQYLEGSPLDRLVLMGLLAAALWVLVARGRRTLSCLELNGALLLFFLYGALSVVWADYPDVAFKRWIKAVGNLVMAMVVLTEADPGAALRTLLRRTGFLLIPLSVLLIKYYPELGRGYDRWTWTPYYGGVTTTGKNGLGYVCMIFGLASLWRFLETALSGEPGRRARPLAAHGFVLVMTLWLFWKADSATSLACFLLGGALMVVTSLPGLAAPAAVHVLFGTMLVFGVSAMFVNAGTALVEAMGRDPTLTGRTDLWEELLRMTVDPWFGAGFESFWLGERTEALWRKYWWHPNQAHNGYLETYLNLGWIGVTLLVLTVVAGYRSVVARFRIDPAIGRLSLAYFAMAVAYNLTEAAFKGIHVVWIMFLLAVTVFPSDSHAEDR